MIFISAGHYPSAPGAKWERFVEHDEAVFWAAMLVGRIGIKRSMLVPTGVLKTKVDFINERIMNGDIAVEIHFNAARDKNNNPVGKGCETLYYPGSEKGLAIAEAIQQVLSTIFPPNRGAKEGWYRMDPSRGADFFLAKTKCPSIIVEPEFVHRSEIIQEKREDAVAAMSTILMELDA